MWPSCKSGFGCKHKEWPCLSCVIWRPNCLDSLSAHCAMTPDSGSLTPPHHPLQFASNGSLQMYMQGSNFKGQWNKWQQLSGNAVVLYAHLRLKEACRCTVVLTGTASMPCKSLLLCQNSWQQLCLAKRYEYQLCCRRCIHVKPSNSSKELCSI